MFNPMSKADPTATMQRGEQAAEVGVSHAWLSR